MAKKSSAKKKHAQVSEQPVKDAVTKDTTVPSDEKVEKAVSEGGDTDDTIIKAGKEIVENGKDSTENGKDIAETDNDIEVVEMVKVGVLTDSPIKAESMKEEPAQGEAEDGFNQPDTETEEPIPREQPIPGESIPVVEVTPETSNPTEPPSAIPVISHQPQIAETEAPGFAAPKKRLTLQERLALAAKSGKSKKKAVVSQDDTPADTPGSSPRSSLDLHVAPVAHKIEPGARDDTAGRLPEEWKTLDKDELIRVVEEVMQNLISSSVVSRSGTPDPTSDTLRKKLAQKDSQMAELLEEGRKLSIKELKLNETIRRLKVQDAESESRVGELTQKNESLERELGVLKEHETKAKEHDSLKAKYDALVKAKAASDAELTSLKAENFRAKYADQVEETKSEALRNKSLNKQLSDAKGQMDTFKRQSAAEISELKLKVEREKSKLFQANSENELEVKRLESKVEELRYKAEGNASDMSSRSTDELSKLQQSHDSLHGQYISAQENWKTIESQLMNKINVFESVVSSLNKKEVAYQKKIRVLTNDLKNKAMENDAMLEATHAQTAQQANLTQELGSKTAELVDATAKFNGMKEIYDSERKSYLAKIGQLEHEITKLRENTSSGQSLYADSTPRRNYSNVSGLSMEMGNESPVLPRISSARSIPQRHANYTMTETFSEDDDSGFNDETSNFTFNQSSRVDMYHQSNGPSIQLVEKMSSQVRRLEIELATAKDEHAKLAAEKKEAQGTIIGLMQDNESIESLRDELRQLKETVEERGRREATMLEIIGEKEDTIEELRNDVMDLKDICKQQVQEMIKASMENRVDE